jgi:hypothetical protein
MKYEVQLFDGIDLDWYEVPEPNKFEDRDEAIARRDALQAQAGNPTVISHYDVLVFNESGVCVEIIEPV